MSDTAIFEDATPHAGGCGCAGRKSACGCGGKHAGGHVHHAPAAPAQHTGHGGCGCRGIRGLRRTHAVLGALLILFIALHFSASALGLFPQKYEALALFLRGLADRVPSLQVGLLLLLGAQGVTGLMLLRRSGLRFRSARCEGDSAGRYFLQRWSGVVILGFLAVHVSMAMLRVGHPDVESVRRGLFAGSVWLILLYVLAVAATVFHSANGAWTGSSVWGLRDARPDFWLRLCMTLGILLAGLGVLALWPFIT